MCFLFANFELGFILQSRDVQSGHPNVKYFAIILLLELLFYYDIYVLVVSLMIIYNISCTIQLKVDKMTAVSMKKACVTWRT